MKSNALRICALLLGAILATSCSTLPLQQSPAGNGPAAELLAQADQMQQRGDIDTAIAQIERAVRIEPRNAYAWHRLAALHLANGELNKAEQFARRSNQFAASNRELIDANQRIIEEVNQLRLKKGG